MFFLFLCMMEKEKEEKERNARARAISTQDKIKGKREGTVSKCQLVKHHRAIRPVKQTFFFLQCLRKTTKRNVLLISEILTND